MLKNERLSAMKKWKNAFVIGLTELTNNNQEMNENIELPEEQEPLLIGKDTNGKIVIQKGKQKIIVHAWEIKLLKKIVFCITEE